MMKKPAAAKAKAKAASASKRPRSSAASPSPRAKILRSEEAVDRTSTPLGMRAGQLPPTPCGLSAGKLEGTSLHSQLQDALSRAAAAEAKEELAKEEAKRALQECKDAKALAQQRSERAASAEGQLKMLREVYDQMHQAYNGSMTLVKSVVAALKGKAEEQIRWGAETDTMPLQTNSSPIPIADIAANSSTSSYTAGLSASSVKEDCAPSPPPTTPMRGPKASPEMTPPNLLRGGILAAEADCNTMEKSDPKKVLGTMPWPATINQWGQLQNTVWAGHEPLPKDWLRIWSKSHDATYYLNVATRTTTFNLSDVK